MRTVMRIVATAVALAGPVRASAAPDAAADVRAAFEAYDEGWRAYDIGKIVDAFAAEFEWTNEVGLRFDDKTRLRHFLGRLFGSPAFRAGKSGPLVIRSIRLVGADVAIVSSSEATDGQTDVATGKVVPVVHTNELTVMQRQDGRWGSGSV